MGGGNTKPKKNTATDENNELIVAVHKVRKTSITGQPKKGAFNSGKVTMSKLRTRSDFCLVRIFEEEIVRTAFEKWCSTEINLSADGITYLTFIQRVNQIKFAETTTTSKELIMKVYEEFIADAPADQTTRTETPAAASGRQSGKIVVDSATKDTIKLAFASKTADTNIFDLAYEKAYQNLKFDYMPRFLISDDFMKLEATTRGRRGSSSYIVDMTAILKEKGAFIQLVAFLKEAKNHDMNNHTLLWGLILEFGSGLKVRFLI